MDTLALVKNAAASGKISSTAATNITEWVSKPQYQEYRAEIEQLITREAWQQLEDNFFKVVPFGTGGRRGTVGIGTNRINKVTLGQSAQGMVHYLFTFGADTAQRGVVIAHDTRTTSVEFAQLVATVFAANGFKVYLFDGFRATPELSFAVRRLHAAAGVVISASHNPPPDNGFKAYWSAGGQVVPPHDEGIMSQVGSVTDVATTDFTQAVNRGAITMIGSDIDEAYVAAVVNESLVASRSATIVYSPLHGAGARSVIPVLAQAGFKEVTIVTEQQDPDGRFPNIKNNIPNPEVRDASDLALRYAQRLQADVAITTDPDADRLGVIARGAQGTYQFFNGNQIAALIGYHVLSQLKAQGKLSPQHFVVKTIVTTDCINAQAADFGVRVYDNILIGFKYVAELIQKLEDKETFVFGGEESHGILKGSYTRDKDAAVAALLMCELVSTLKDAGKTLPELLNDLYRRYGIYWETLQNIQYPGAQGAATMQKLMAGLRTTPPQHLGSYSVVRVIDRLSPASEGMKGDVLIYHLSDDGQTRLTVRPSGTEPKLKIYTQVHQAVATDASDADLEGAQKEADVTAATVTKAMTDYFDQLLRM